MKQQLTLQKLCWRVLYTWAILTFSAFVLLKQVEHGSFWLEIRKRVVDWILETGIEFDKLN